MNYTTNTTNYIKPNWPAPKNIRAYTTKRTGGVSRPPYDSFNLNLRTGDNINDVVANRHKLSLELNLSEEPFWLKQEHTNIVLNLNLKQADQIRDEVIADAAFASTAGPVCAILTADCVPILMCDQNGTIVAAIHAGWKGIAAGIITATIKAMATDPTKLLAWLGPAIGPTAFVINHELVETFQRQLTACKIAFVKSQNHFLANIYSLASIYLKQEGVTQIYGGNYCTFTQQDLFFSFRRDGEKSGRMASLIWIEN